MKSAKYRRLIGAILWRKRIEARKKIYSTVEGPIIMAVSPWLLFCHRGVKSMNKNRERKYHPMMVHARTAYIQASLPANFPVHQKLRLCM